MMKKLTQRQRFWLAHVRRATQSGQTLKAYAEAQGISLSALYEASSKRSRGGIVDGEEAAASGKPSAAFVPVNVTNTGTMACRLTHDSGWVLECERLPDPDWLIALWQRGPADAVA